MSIEVVYALLVIVGLILEWVIYSVEGDRSGGIVTIPLIAVYTLLYPSFGLLLWFIVSVCYIAAEIMYRGFLLYGRRLFLAVVAFCIVVTIPSMFLLGFERFFVISIVPGIVAYNIHYERRFSRTFMLTLAKYLTLLGLGYLLLNL
ncbi:MAG: poly-gamma-glutamate biosynthesis protein PgsC/CapC [Candidatus Bathyarchaeia archaeon]|nr:hypothetical protein [Candidatus Bathyarchaeota archaeon]